MSKTLILSLTDKIGKKNVEYIFNGEKLSLIQISEPTRHTC